MPETTKASYDGVVQSLDGFRNGLDRLELISIDLCIQTARNCSCSSGTIEGSRHILKWFGCSIGQFEALSHPKYLRTHPETDLYGRVKSTEPLALLLEISDLSDCARLYFLSKVATQSVCKAPENLFWL